MLDVHLYLLRSMFNVRCSSLDLLSVLCSLSSLCLLARLNPLHSSSMNLTPIRSSGPMGQAGKRFVESVGLVEFHRRWICTQPIRPIKPIEQIKQSNRPFPIRHYIRCWTFDVQCSSFVPSLSPFTIRCLDVRCSMFVFSPSDSIHHSMFDFRCSISSFRPPIHHSIEFDVRCSMFVFSPSSIHHSMLDVRCSMFVSSALPTSPVFSEFRTAPPGQSRLPPCPAACGWCLR